MKRAMIYLIAVSALFTMLLSGCGDVVDKKPAASPTDEPKVTMMPDAQMPDVDDGVVGDTDGMITDGDTGTNAGGSTNVMDVPKSSGGTTGTGGTGAKTGRA